MSIHPDRSGALTLDQLLCREDIWRGKHNHFSSGQAVATGHGNLDALLLHRGWPRGTLIEICQQPFQGEWQLFLPSLLSLDSGLIVLLNPPTEPFSQALIQAGVDLDRLVVINAGEKSQFLRCFRELARTGNCAALLAWQPEAYFTYTELRKCLLAAADGKGLYTLFRPAPAQQQNSPASLRLFTQMIPSGLEITVFKQKGMLHRRQPKPLVLPMPANWRTVPSHGELDRPAHGKSARAPVFNLRENR